MLRRTLLRLLPGLVSCLVLSARAEAPARIKVACVGDSITAGSGASDRATASYPALLQALLGETHEVRNFGVGGATMLRQGDKPYFKQGAHKQAMEFKADIAVVKLGTNDTKPQNWKFKDDFAADARALIAELRAANPAVKIYVALPVPAYPGNWGINEPGIAEGVIPVLRAVAASGKTEVIDLHAALSGHPEFFPDKVHPNDAGYRVIAATVFQALTGREADLSKLPAPKKAG